MQKYHLNIIPGTEYFITRDVPILRLKPTDGDLYIDIILVVEKLREFVRRKQLYKWQNRVKF
jgi:hypothetical protein